MRVYRPAPMAVRMPARRFLRRNIVASIPFEQTHYDRRQCWIGSDDLLPVRAGDVAIAKRRLGRPGALFCLFLHALAGFRGQIVDVVQWVRDALHASHADERREHEEAINRHQAEFNRLNDRIHSMYVDKLDVMRSLDKFTMRKNANGQTFSLFTPARSSVAHGGIPLAYLTARALSNREAIRLLCSREKKWPFSFSTVYGGQGADVLAANLGNFDLIYGGNTGSQLFATTSFGSSLYGGQGNDNLAADFGGDDLLNGGLGDDGLELNTSPYDTLLGGQGNDHFYVNKGSEDLLYGNQGNDFFSFFSTSRDTAYGGQGDDTLSTEQTSSLLLNGNLGNDRMYLAADFNDTAFGGQGSDVITTISSTNDIIYGNLGNDTIDIAGRATGNTVYGGQGDDNLIDNSGISDILNGNLGNDYLAGNDLFADGYVFNGLTTAEMVTVTDFLHGSDLVSMSATTNGATGFVALNDTLASNAAIALSVANNFYTTTDTSGAAEYLLIYGGMDAGYLFYNGDAGGHAPVDGASLLNDNGEFSLTASDIVNSHFA